MQVPWPRGTRRDSAAPATPARSFCGSFEGFAGGEHGSARNGPSGEGVTDSHATPVPSHLPPPPRGRELHPLALPAEAPWTVAPRLPVRSQTPRFTSETPHGLPWGRPSAPALPRRRPEGAGEARPGAGTVPPPSAAAAAPHPRGSWKAG